MKLVKDNRGATSFPLIISITLSMLFIFCGISEYFRLIIIAQGVRNAVQTAVISTVNDNYDDVYHGVREGYSGAYQPGAGDFEESIDYGDIYFNLDNRLGLMQSGGRHIKPAETGAEYALWGLDVKIRNAPLASSDSASQRFTADCTIELSVPMQFAQSVLPPMHITLKTSAGFTPQF